MDGFSYSNIFETKGIEYLAIIAFFAILIPFWIILNKKVNVKKRVEKIISTLSPANLRIPQGVFFSKNHTWTHLEKSGSAKVGLDDLLMRITGEVSLTENAKPGDIIQKGQLLAGIGHDGKQLQIYSPISGIILATNPLLSEEPSALNEDPFRTGWIYQIKPSDWMKETRSYYLAEEATSWMNRELVRFKDFVATSSVRNSIETNGIILQDGGEIRNHLLAEMPDQLWKDFQKDFLNQTD